LNNNNAEYINLLYLIMPNDQQAAPVIQPEPAKQYKFPFLHLITGLILSFISLVVLVSIWANIILSIETHRTLNFLPGVLQAFLIPELLIIGILALLAIRTHRSGKLGYRSSYITMIIINLLGFCFICFVMGSIQC